MLSPQTGLGLVVLIFVWTDLRITVFELLCNLWTVRGLIRMTLLHYLIRCRRVYTVCVRRLTVMVLTAHICPRSLPTSCLTSNYFLAYSPALISNCQLYFPRVIGEGQLDDPIPPGWPLWRTTYLCTTSPLRMLSKWPWISRCGDYWQQAELCTDGACRIMTIMNESLIKF